MTLVVNVLKYDRRLKLRQEGPVSLCRLLNDAAKRKCSRRFLNESNEGDRNIEAPTTPVRVEHLCDSKQRTVELTWKKSMLHKSISYIIKNFLIIDTIFDLDVCCHVYNYE